MKTVFEGRIIKVETGTVALPNGEMLAMEVARHPGGSAVVAFDKEKRVCLLYQYRVVTDSWLWELPAGKRDDQEPPLETAERELAEEAGCVAGNWRQLGTLISSPGVFDEVIYLYLATELNPVSAQQESHEIFEVHWVDYTEALDLARNGKINDAKTVAALFRAEPLVS